MKNFLTDCWIFYFFTKIKRKILYKFFLRLRRKSFCNSTKNLDKNVNFLSNFQCFSIKKIVKKSCKLLKISKSPFFQFFSIRNFILFQAQHDEKLVNCPRLPNGGIAFLFFFLLHLESART